MKQTIYFADGPAGSGKTYSLHKFIEKLNGFATIATQTNDLSEQQAKDLANLGIKSKVISLQRTKNCTKSYERHCEDMRGSVAIINQAVALQTFGTHEFVGEKLPLNAMQHLFIDEYFSPVQRFELKDQISGSHSSVAKLFKAKATEFPGVVELITSPEIAELAMYGNSRDSSFKEHVIDLCRMVNSPHYRCFLSTENYLRFQAALIDENETADEKDARQRLTVWAWMLPSILEDYASVTLMGAHFAKSKINLAWRDKVNFVPHPEIKGVRYSDFSHKTDLITVRHISEDDVSMYRLEKIGYQNFVDEAAEVFEAAYPNGDYLVTLSAKDDYEWNGENGIQISPNPLGLNRFQHINMSIHLAPLNPSDADVWIWEAVCGVTKEELMTAQAYEMQYQTATRTSIRDGKKNSTKELVFAFLDRRSADHFRHSLGIKKPSELLRVPCLTDYQNQPRRTRSDKKSDDEKHLAKMARQRARRAEQAAVKAQQQAATFTVAAE
ncbi:hypothetical protein [Ferirhizobium litorale]|uniref:Uncharacterized protein n=1 Tax=Ferirhizobium litorale TaxID=2927786 RepID=A0AAE3QB30_9HYPH|nr:hypothetical protein [Fererhizobium litorale]MDI7920708.1 hypothetical protein [Fererhizobium litorale]